MAIKLYSYYRSSAAYRVRIAFNLKGIEHQLMAVNLLTDEQLGDDYQQLNGQGLVPSLELNDGTVISQSTAIVEWLESQYTDRPLLPKNPIDTAKVRSLCNIIACDIHPLNNLRVLKYLTTNFVINDHDKTAWYQHWVISGFTAIEAMVEAAPYCFGNQPTLADAYLIPQVYNALRFNTDLSAYPRISAIYKHCNQQAAFHQAHPDQQEDKPNKRAY